MKKTTKKRKRYEVRTGNGTIGRHGSITSAIVRAYKYSRTTTLNLHVYDVWQSPDKWLCTITGA